MDQKFRVTIHSRRRRLTDPDGVYAKAAIDGLTAGGILEDDSAKFVESVRYTQELAGTREEETVITLELVTSA